VESGGRNDVVAALSSDRDARHRSKTGPVCVALSHSVAGRS
jgi:hypothetical protein